MTVQPLVIPKHVAIIMDGNGRWAEAKAKPRHEGHREGAKAVREVVRGCRSHGVSCLTLYAFSLANWNRPRIEVDALMRLLVYFADREAEELCEREISVGVIGRPDDLPASTRKALDKLIERTSPGHKMRLTLALSYSGRADVTAMARRAAELAAQGLLRPEQVDASWVLGNLSTGGLPDPDLVIRTGGEHRLSDFLPLESVYAELYFSSLLWPDFREQHLLEAFASYTARERRFGKTGAQVRGEST